MTVIFLLLLLGGVGLLLWEALSYRSHEYVAPLAFGMILVSFVLWAVASGREHDQFMAACLKDHKEYECTAAWRAGEPATPMIIMTR